MGNSGWTADAVDITIPPDAGPSTPRIYVGQNDPLASFLNQDAAIVFYWGPNRAFILSVENSGGAGTHGQLHLWSSAPDGLYQWLDLDHPVSSPPHYGTLGEKIEQFTIKPGSLRLIPSTASTNPGSTPTLYIGDLIYTQTPSAPMVDTLLYGRSMGRGSVGEQVLTTSSGAIGTSETIVYTIPSRTYYAGRAYEITTKGGAQPSAANCVFNMRVRKTNIAGQILGEFDWFPCTVSGTVHPASAGQGAGVKFRCTSDVTTALVVTGRSTATGNVTSFATTNTPREARAMEIGAGADYATYPVLV